MLIHIRPACHSRTLPVDLVDVQIPELGLHLQAGCDLKAGKPYPNKRYTVAAAAREVRDKAGIFIEAPDEIEYFVATTRWNVRGEIIEHEAHYNIVDHEFDAVSDDAVLWGARWPSSFMPRCAPVRIMPSLQVDDWGDILRQKDVLWLPSLEREPMLSRMSDWDEDAPKPALEYAFQAIVPAR